MASKRQRARRERVRRRVGLGLRCEQSELRRVAEAVWEEAAAVALQVMDPDVPAGEAAEIGRQALRADPDDTRAQLVFAEALEATARGTGPGGRHGGAGDRALASFQDRSVLHELTRALSAWVEGSPLEAVVSAHVADWLGRACRLEATPARRGRDGQGWPAGWELMAREHALLMSEEEDDDERSVLALFAADPGTPAALAEAARSWLDHVHYGLWQVSGPVPRPGLWLTDLVSATRRYVQLSPDQAGVLAPWAVLAGAVVPLDGVWRSTGALAVLTPDEGDALCNAVGELGQKFDLLPAGLRRRPRVPGPESCLGVLAGARPPLPPAAARALSVLVGAMLPSLLGSLEWARSGPAAASRGRARRPARAPRAKGPKARRAFVEAWADQPLDELRGLTARQAAADERRWIELEALLRNLEHDAARAGESCEWLEWVREELDLGGIAPAARATV